MGKRVAILQSNYIPWKGYFDLINYVDEFILYDTAQFTKNDWRNRNKIKTPGGVHWLTIPVFHNFGQLIEDTLVSDPDWGRKHLSTIKQCYAKSRYFADYEEVLGKLYLESDEKHLSLINERFLRAVCGILGIDTPITWSSDYELIDGQTERLVHLCKQAGATEYLSGPAAKNYMDESLFEQAGITLSYIDYSGYPEYDQLYPPFEHGVSVLDLILNEGPNGSGFMKSFSNR